MCLKFVVWDRVNVVPLPVRRMIGIFFPSHYKILTKAEVYPATRCSQGRYRLNYWGSAGPNIDNSLCRIQLAKILVNGGKPELLYSKAGITKSSFNSSHVTGTFEKHV